MKQFFRLVTASIVVMLAFGSIHASHEAGVSISYSCVNACTVEVTLRVYRDCSGSASITNNVVWNTTSPGCTAPPALAGWSAQSTVEVTPICPSVPTRCTSPTATINGIEEFLWTRSYNICPSAACIYNLVWTDCCRNSAITTLTNPGSVGIYIGGTTVNTGLLQCNNSPVYTTAPLFYACAGQDYDIHQGAFDPDNDSLAYSLGPCLGTGGAPVPYGSGFSATTPLGPTWNVSIDPVTGILHLQAVPGNNLVGVICIYVNEFRNGILIASHVRDMQVAILNCPLNQQPTFNAISNLSAGSRVGDEIFLCAATSFCFDLTCTDVNASQTLKMYWDSNLPGASFSEIGNPSVLDTVTGLASSNPGIHFCWTPPGNGDFQIRIRLEDDACPVYGIQDKIIQIHVGSGLSLTANAVATTCPDAAFTASACGAGPFSYTWSGAGGLSGTTASLSHTYPGPGSYAWQCILSNGTASDTVNGTIVIGGTPSPTTLLSGTYFVSPCTGSLYDTIQGPSGYTSYLWSNGATTQDLIVNIGGNYGLTVTDASGCSYSDVTTLYWASPDIYGYVLASTGLPLQNQKIYLIEHDTLLQALNAVDSMWTDSSGYYYFCNVVDTNVFLKAAPRAFDYPNELPTYADTTLFWNNAMAFLPLSMGPFQHDFQTLFGTNPGGPGFIGGLISQGANKTNGVGDPMPNVRIFLRDRNSGAVLGWRMSNAGGYFSFNSVPFGDYEFAVDVPNVDAINVPSLLLDAQNSSYDSLDFRLHSTYLELVMPTVAVGQPIANTMFTASPNPFGKGTRLNLSLGADAKVSLELVDLFGKVIQVLSEAQQSAGSYSYEIGENLPAGLYFARLKVNDQSQVLKLLKL